MKRGFLDDKKAQRGVLYPFEFGAGADAVASPVSETAVETISRGKFRVILPDYLP
jgi:hypothetical protein